jgi:thiamine biosynthesis lipoprotein
MSEKFEFEAIGTGWQIDIGETMTDGARQDLRRRILDRIAVFDKDYSRFRSDSLVAEMSRQAGTYALPTDAEPMLRLYKHLYDLTRGSMTPLVGQLLSDAGYDATYSLKPGDLHEPPDWEDVLEFDFPKLTLKRPALLDFGAIGKGYLIDIIGGLIQTAGHRTYCIDAGGDILHRDPAGARLRVGLEDPFDAAKAIGVAEIGDRRTWDRFHHIMDPHTLESPRHLAAVWTVAASTIKADALATALFFTSPESLLQYYDFEYLLCFPDRTVSASPNFPAELFVRSAG